MSDDLTQPLPEHHRHEAPEPKANPYRVWVIVLAIILGLALIAFLVWFFALRGGGGGTPTSTPTHSDTPTQTPTPTPTPTPTQTVAPPPLANCTTDTSSVSLGTPDTAAGTTRVPLVFTNTSGADCALEGYPTVEFVGDGDGTQIGAGSTQDTSGPAPDQLVLSPGQSGSALLTITTAGNVCDPVDVDGFRVIPPGSTDAFFIANTDYPACEAGNTSLLKVTAIGQN